MDCVWSIVKGTEITLNRRKLRHLLEMPRIKICYPSLENDFEGLRRILDRKDVENFNSHKANQLLAEMRLLHSIVSRIIFPKTSRFDWMSKRKLAVYTIWLKGRL